MTQTQTQKTLTAEFLQERTTKRMVRFYELDNGSGTKVTGILYVSQAALRQLGYEEGDILVVTLNLKEAQF